MTLIQGKVLYFYLFYFFSFSLNLDEFKFSQEENFMKKYNDNKVEIDFTKNKVQISEINLSDKKDLKKIKEELIENNYDDNVRLETITGSKKIKGDRLNYNPLTEENISNQNIKTDSIMNIKDKLNEEMPKVIKIMIIIKQPINLLLKKL